MIRTICTLGQPAPEPTSQACRGFSPSSLRVAQAAAAEWESLKVALDSLVVSDVPLLHLEVAKQFPNDSLVAHLSSRPLQSIPSYLAIRGLRSRTAMSKSVPRSCAAAVGVAGQPRLAKALTAAASPRLPVSDVSAPGLGLGSRGVGQSLRRELKPLFVGGDGDVELVEEAGEPKEPECGGPGLAEPDWCAPLVGVCVTGDCEAHNRHARGD